MAKNDEVPDNVAQFPAKDEIVVDRTQVEAWCTRLENLKTAAAEKNGEHGAETKNVVEQSGYHKKAFNDFRAIRRMSPSKRADYLRTFRALFNEYDKAIWQREGFDLVDQAEEEKIPATAAE